MSVLVVANQTHDWPFDIAHADVIDARAYLIRPDFNELRGVKVFNLCRSYRYQSTGYYVSLLAEARGHKVIPNIMTIQDLKQHAIVRLVNDDLDALIQKSLEPIKSDEFTLSIYFGRNMAQRHCRLALRLFNQFQAPLLRARFARTEQGWQLRRLTAISANEVPPSHWPFVIEVATKYFEGRQRSPRPSARPRFDLAILYNDEDPEPPSDKPALKKFVKAADSLGMRTEVIARDDYGRLAEFDALFIRETTNVNHYTYRFARRAASEGLVVIDDPQSIVRCTNKVYLTELLSRHKIPMPKSLVLHRDNVDKIEDHLGFPCVIKQPDSAFSRGVVKVEDREELEAALQKFFSESELLVAQQFLPTTFDWRIGILDRQPLFAAKYFMAPQHWQIVHPKRTGPRRFGKAETLAVDAAPRRAVRAALKAANLMGDGLYGVDVKQSNGSFYVIEVNDNPNIDAGCEDTVLRQELYRRVMEVFLRRIERRKALPSPK